jgi:hypothetical protein
LADVLVLKAIPRGPYDDDYQQKLEVWTVTENVSEKRSPADPGLFPEAMAVIILAWITETGYLLQAGGPPDTVTFHGIDLDRKTVFPISRPYIEG